MKAHFQKIDSRARGVALVVTLIFLSLITFMAVTFLVVSRHGTEQVNTVVQQNIARDAAVAAFNQAEARIIAQMMLANSNGNGFNLGLEVSTNYQSSFYDTTQSAGSNVVANVNYYDSGGNYLPAMANPNSPPYAYLRMLNNLMVLPRAPVFVTTNRNFPPDFRFYQDLNRNGVYDTNGPGYVIDQFGITNFENLVGDPEWVGILEHPDQPHSRSNQFIARWLYFAQPIGNSLDLNFIHNEAKMLGTNLGDSFLRDQGVGSWEINLAGFLNGLDPARWDYLVYDVRRPPALGGPGAFANTGAAFDDALAIMNFRDGANLANLRSFDSLYPWATPFYASDFIDGYAYGDPTIIPGLTQVNPDPDSLVVGQPWSGADPINRFFTPQDVFNTTNSSFPTSLLNPFANRLLAAGQNTNSLFERDLFYRMLAQISADSEPESTNKLNLNYINVGGYFSNNAFTPWESTNFVPWGAVTNGALMFFTNAANRLLQTHTNYIVSYLANGVTNTNYLSTGFIPVYPVNYYTPAVHRMLQLAANIYDAANRTTVGSSNNFDFPSVFRPTFTNSGSNIFIDGYVEVGTNGDYNIPPNSLPTDLQVVMDSINSPTNRGSNINIYGIPWIIGAKKGLPNFNQISMQSFSQISRKVQIVKPSLSADRTAWTTNIQYIIGVSNVVTVEAWNSYMSNFNRTVDIGGVDTLVMNLTNENGSARFFSNSIPFIVNGPSGLTVTNWPGYPADQTRFDLVQQSFRVPLMTSAQLMPDSVFRAFNNTFLVVTNATTTPFDSRDQGFPLPLFGLISSNRMRFVMIDDVTGRVLDYVQLDGMRGDRDLTAELQGNDYFGPGGLWATNRQHGTASIDDALTGVLFQINASLQQPPYQNPDNYDYPTPLTDNDWANMVYPPPSFSSVSKSVQSFNDFYNKNTNANSQLSNQVPYTPTRKVSVYYTWQANDPLVHYTLDDLTGLGDLSTLPQTNYVYTNLAQANIARVNDRYHPWGNTLRNNTNSGSDPYSFDLTLKDPGVTRSDDWQFPTNKFPSIGWLGRVHRGTPWQTVYMKSSPVSDFNNWQNWTGNANTTDASASQPINDWAIFDLFTAAPNDNATRGQLSVNQSGFASWAAVLDGVVVVTNQGAGQLAPIIIDPNTNAAALINIVNSINTARAAKPGGVFTRVGDVLSAPALSSASPFLNTNDGINMTDIEYERLPQQIMSLLRVGSPRYVIYAYGQSLRPADASLQTGGPFYGTCTNYQITGEMVTRTVVRFEPDSTISSPTNLYYETFNPTHNPVMPSNPGLFGPNVVSPIRAVVESYNILPPE